MCNHNNNSFFNGVLTGTWHCAEGFAYIVHLILFNPHNALMRLFILQMRKHEQFF
jgi:hypothetical protein